MVSSLGKRGDTTMRARSLELHSQTRLKLSRLRMQAERDGYYRVAKRIHAVLLCSRGRTSGEIADLLDAPRSRVSEWLHNYERWDVEGLLEGQRSGRPPRMSDKQNSQLADIIDSGPVAYGFLGGVWTSPMVARVIEEEFCQTYHPGHVRKLLHRLGFSVQRPKRQLARARPEELDRWHRYTYPRIKKKRSR